jgi:hypothetical protein
MSLYCKGRFWDGFWWLDAITCSGKALEMPSHFPGMA